VFLDEFGANLSMVPLHGRSRAGTRVRMNKPNYRSPNITFAGAISLAGVVALDALHGTATIANFTRFVHEQLIRVLGKGKILIMDNLRAHRNADVVALIESTGAKVLFLPPYSPDFNPIEECWSKLKNLVRKARARDEEALFNAVDDAAQLVTSSDIVGWVRHAGYAA
jgi:transposase